MPAPIGSIGAVRFRAYNFSITAPLGVPTVRKILQDNPRRVFLAITKSTNSANNQVLFDDASMTDTPATAAQLALGVTLPNIIGTGATYNNPAPTNPIAIIAASNTTAAGVILEGVLE